MGATENMGVTFYDPVSHHIKVHEKELTRGIQFNILKEFRLEI